MQNPGRKRLGLAYRFTPAQVLVLGFAALIFLGAFLLWLPVSQEPGSQISFLNALFTATSAVCVTGLVVVDTASQFSATGEWIVLGLIQAGGLGILTLSALMLVLVGKRISLRERLMMQEALGSFSIAGVVRLTRTIVLTALAIEMVGAALLSFRFALEHPWPKAIYWGVFHAVSAFNNAGFDVTSASLRPFALDPFILLVISLLIFLGGIGFMVIEDLWRHRGKWERLTLHSRLVLKVSAIMIAVGAVLILALEYSNPFTLGELPWFHRITNAIFASVTPRTAGFESVATGYMLDVTLLLTVVLMFIGASPGGTGGGIKTSSLAAIVLTVKATVTGKEEVNVMGRRIPRDLIDKSLAIAFIAMALVVTGTGLLYLTEARSLMDPSSKVTVMKLFFEVVSAFGTVGLSAGVTPNLSEAGRMLIIVMMFAGRVGPLTVAVALAQRKTKREPIHYPEDRVMIG